MTTDSIIKWTGARSFTLDPKDPLFFQNPYSIYAQMQQRGDPVFWENYGFWCLVGFDAVDHCLRDRRFARLPPASATKKVWPEHLSAFAEAEVWSLLALEPPEHTHLRRMVNKAFVSRQVEAMADDITQLTHNCIDQFESSGTAELLSQFATPIPVTVIARLLGVPDDATADLLRWSHTMVKVYTLTQSKQDELDANRASTEFMQYLHEIILHKKRYPEDDLLSHLVSQQNGNSGPTDAQIVSVAILLLNAGHEATVHQIGNAIAGLLLDPPQESNWWQAPATASRVVEECMRHDAPLHLFTRFAQESVALSDEVSIEKGTEIALLLGAANRCPMKFSHADKLNSQRASNAHVSFGAGLHFCIGAPLARLEIRIALCTLFERLPGMQLSRPVEYKDSYHFHGLSTLHVEW